MLGPKNNDFDRLLEKIKLLKLIAQEHETAQTSNEAGMQYACFRAEKRARRLPPRDRAMAECQAAMSTLSNHPYRRRDEAALVVPPQELSIAMLDVYRQAKALLRLSWTDTVVRADKVELCKAVRGLVATVQPDHPYVQAGENMTHPIVIADDITATMIKVEDSADEDEHIGPEAFRRHAAALMAKLRLAREESKTRAVKDAKRCSASQLTDQRSAGLMETAQTRSGLERPSCPQQ